MKSLIVKNISKKYKSREVVKSVSLTLNRGEIVGLLGPNGAGKTTSFYIIVGLLQCTHGNILLENQDITNLPVHARANLGMSYLPQEASIFRKLTVSDNILSVLELRKNLSKKQRIESLNKLLKEFNIEHIKDTMGVSLSGGERRRAEIARALATEPKYILLDEPFAGIDPISVIDVKNIINQLCKKNIGVLITDHNVRETLDICKRAYIVSNGEIICEGSTQEILLNKQVRSVYLGEDFNL
ncbi:LPS export ABC transporter ATP-binding protein [Gammaproteobacteria bacterium]|nr:LPS export ABC transporter ATP-binding protein [Gammaproteobacteria bacterium]